MPTSESTGNLISESIVPDRIMDVVKKVRTGETTDFESVSLAMRIDDATGNNTELDELKDRISDEQRFDLSTKFFTVTHEEDEVLDTEGIKLPPVTSATIQYMFDGLLIGVSRYGKASAEEQGRLLDGIEPIFQRALYQGSAVDAVYLTLGQLRLLIEKVRETMPGSPRIEGLEKILSALER